jgi:hypothetical protein
MQHAPRSGILLLRIRDEQPVIRIHNPITIPYLRPDQ